jgi:hypothetical protein
MKPHNWLATNSRRFIPFKEAKPPARFASFANMHEERTNASDRFGHEL